LDSVNRLQKGVELKITLLQDELKYAPKIQSALKSRPINDMNALRLISLRLMTTMVLASCVDFNVGNHDLVLTQHKIGEVGPFICTVYLHLFQGGCSVVYRATLDGKPVAVKYWKGSIQVQQIFEMSAIEIANMR
jgi:hypothetical protein